MKITNIRVSPVGEEKLKAFVSVVFDDCFIVSDIKIIDGNNGLFISMPSKKSKSGKFRDIAHPLNSEMRGKMERAIIDEYNNVLETEPSGAPADIPVEQGNAAEEEGLSAG